MAVCKCACHTGQGKADKLIGTQQQSNLMQVLLMASARFFTITHSIAVQNIKLRVGFVSAIQAISG